MAHIQAMNVQTNLMSANVHRSLKTTDAQMTQATRRLSSGLRINSASDDAAGMAISEKMKAQIRGMKQAQTNSEDGRNLIRTMDGAMDKIQDMMIRQRELLINAINDTNTGEAEEPSPPEYNSDKGKIQLEIDMINDELAMLCERAEFNKIKLLNAPDDPKLGKPVPLWIQNGANAGMGTFLDRYDCRPEALGIKEIVTDPTEKAIESLENLDDAFGRVNTYRAKAGAIYNRLEMSEVALGIAFMNLEESMSRIQDADMARESMERAKADVKMNSGTAMMAQANSMPMSVMELLNTGYGYARS